VVWFADEAVTVVGRPALCFTEYGDEAKVCRGMRLDRFTASDYTATSYLRIRIERE